MGTETHTDDMKVLNTALERLRSSSKVPAIRLFVIGGEPAQAGQDWYTRIDVPLGCRRYPEFVSWLRDYREYWDIGLAPLVDTMFNGAKSNLKYLEYSAFGPTGNLFHPAALYRNRAASPDWLAGGRDAGILVCCN